jgi:hypothetical protein
MHYDMTGLLLRTCFSRVPQCSRHCIMLRVSMRLIMTCPAADVTMSVHTAGHAYEAKVTPADDHTAVQGTSALLSTGGFSKTTCEEHGPADDGDVEVAGLGHKLEGPVQVEQREDVLRPAAASNLGRMFSGYTGRAATAVAWRACRYVAAEIESRSYKGKCGTAVKSARLALQCVVLNLHRASPGSSGDWRCRPLPRPLLAGSPTPQPAGKWSGPSYALLSQPC